MSLAGNEPTSGANQSAAPERQTRQAQVQSQAVPDHGNRSETAQPKTSRPSPGLRRSMISPSVMALAIAPSLKRNIPLKFQRARNHSATGLDS